MKWLYRYCGKYGKIAIDIERRQVWLDELNREKIWEDGKREFQQPALKYKEIIERVFGDDIDEIFPSRNEKEFWAGEMTDCGYRAYFKDGGWFYINSEGSGFVDPYDF